VKVTLLKVVVLCAIACTTTAVSSAQQKFPMQQGEWSATLPGTTPNSKPTVLLYCLTDETWDKAMIHNPSCSTQNLVITSSGASFVEDCHHGAVENKATVSITFDGKQHMLTKDSVDTTSNGQTTNRAYTVDYRWKGPTCNADADLNLKFKQP
jgi:hypothetical protein